jgi:hypothetical protein
VVTSTPVKLEKKFKPGVIMKIVKYTEKKKVAKVAQLVT